MVKVRTKKEPTRAAKTEIVLGAIVAGLLALIGGLVIGAVCARAESVPEREDFTPVVVRVGEGQTAWEIAGRYCPDTVDRREYLAWCAEANGLAGMGAIRAGQEYVFLEVAR